MSTTIDEKVVEMRFDNKQFENNIQTSLSTLEKLKQSLNLSGASKGLDDVNNAASRVDMSGLSGAVETVRAKFSALQVMGITALTNITNSAINAGKKIVSALTIDPIKTGFSEYETQINAVQTILANTESKGTTIDDVNSALDQLNAYADKTIYNFTEMTRNIGTFTAAGVELDASVSAIQGIANLAAVSGSNSQQASTAMYQLSQALSSGTVKLQDWNSVVNAGMGGQVFQDALKRTATVMGTNVDAMIEKAGSFRESLQEGWITAEVLTKTLDQFTMAAEEGSKEWDAYKKSLMDDGYTEQQANDILKMANTATDAATKVKTLTQLWDTLKESAQSGWTQSWEIIVGDFEEAKVLFTEVSDTLGALIGESAQARTDMLQGWKDLGGRTALIDSVRNAFEGVMGIITPIKEALTEIFPPITSEQLFNLTEGLKNLTEKLKVSEETAEKIKRTFKGVFALFDIILQPIKAVAKGFIDLVGFIAPAGNGILDFTANLGDGIVKFNEFLKSSDVFNKSIKAITGAIGFVIEKLKAFKTSISEAFANFSGSKSDEVSKFADNVRARFEPFTKLGGVVKKVFEGLGKVIEKVAPIFLKLGEILGNVFGKIKDAILGADFNKVIDVINTGLFATLTLSIKKFINTLSGGKEELEGGGGFLDGIKDALSSVTESLETMQASLKSNTLLKIAVAIGILAASLMALSFIDSEKLGISLAAITGLFVELFASMAVFQKLMGKDGFKSMSKVTGAMIGMSVAVLILSAAMSKLAGLEWGDVIKGLLSISVLTGVLVVAAKSLSQAKGKLIKGAGGLVIFAAAILVLAEGVEKLGAMDLKSLGKGLLGVGVLMAELVAFLKLADFGKISVGKGVGLIALAAAISILADAVSKFAGLSVKGLVKGLGAVGVVLIELAAFTRLVGSPKNIISTAVGMTILGGAMLIFAEAVTRMGKLSWEQIGRGMTVMAGSLVLITAALRLMPKNVLVTGIGLAAVAGALIILANALTTMSGMSWEEIGKGLATLAGSMLIITLAMLGMQTALPGAAALLIVAAALNVLAPVLQKLGSMSLAEIGKALLALAGAFVVIGAAGVVLGLVSPLILAMSVAVALLGAGCLAAGVGVLALSAGLAALSVSGAAGAAALVAIVTAILGVLPTIISTLGQIIVAICGVIIEGAPAIAAAVVAVVVAILDILDEAVLKLVEVGLAIIVNILKGIADNIQLIVEAAIDIVTNFIDGISSKISDVIQSGIDLMLSFINGMADGIRNNTDATIDAVDNLMSAIIYAVKAWFSNIITKGSELVRNFASGIKNQASDAVSAAREMISKAVQGIKDKISSFTQAGKDVISGFIKGVKSKASDIIASVKGVVSDAVQAAKNLLGIKSPSRVFARIGEWCDEGFINGLKAFAGKVSKASSDVAGGALDAMSDSIAGISDLVNSGLDAEPTICPVLDLSNVKSGVNSINGMLSANKTLSINARSADAVSASMYNLQNRQNSNAVLSAIAGLQKDIANAQSNVYQINGISYTEGSDVADAIKTIVRATKIDGRS